MRNSKKKLTGSYAASFFVSSVKSSSFAAAPVTIWNLISPKLDEIALSCSLVSVGFFDFE